MRKKNCGLILFRPGGKLGYQPSCTEKREKNNNIDRSSPRCAHVVQQRHVVQHFLRLFQTTTRNAIQNSETENRNRKKPQPRSNVFVEIVEHFRKSQLNTTRMRNENERYNMEEGNNEACHLNGRANSSHKQRIIVFVSINRLPEQ